NGYDVIAQGNHIATSVKPGMENESGELYVKGPNVFMEYLNNPTATKSTFSKDGWFKTGDTAMYKAGAYSILGRTSVDIIKSGGYKISALDIERHLLTHPDIKDCVVVGLPDMTWGQRVAAIIIQKDGSTHINQQTLKKWAADILPSYQIPSIVKVMDDIPKNAMGKVNKKLIVKNVF
ncbi:unnamed protein product, partial [Owenia fusiformis]